MRAWERRQHQLVLAELYLRAVGSHWLVPGAGYLHLQNVRTAATACYRSSGGRVQEVYPWAGLRAVVLLRWYRVEEVLRLLVFGPLVMSRVAQGGGLG